jgi:hypothetical protein
MGVAPAAERKVVICCCLEPDDQSEPVTLRRDGVSPHPKSLEHAGESPRIGGSPHGQPQITAVKVPAMRSVISAAAVSTCTGLTTRARETRTFGTMTGDLLLPSRCSRRE